MWLEHITDMLGVVRAYYRYVRYGSSILQICQVWFEYITEMLGVVRAYYRYVMEYHGMNAEDVCRCSVALRDS